jgi:hypothetical protein
MDLLWGSARKVFKFDGRQQAVERCVQSYIPYLAPKFL